MVLSSVVSSDSPGSVAASAAGLSVASGAASGALESSEASWEELRGAEGEVETAQQKEKVGGIGPGCFAPVPCRRGPSCHSPTLSFSHPPPALKGRRSLW